MRLVLTKSHFENQVMRLTNQFGGGAFSQERINLIFKDCAKLKNDQFTKIVDHLLRNSRYAPLPKDFYDLAGPYIQENYQAQKKVISEQYNSIFTDSERKQIVKAMLQGLNGDMEIFDKILKGLDPSKISNYKCKHCADTGIVLAENIAKPYMAHTAFSCVCDKAEKSELFTKWGKRYFPYYKNARL